MRCSIRLLVTIAAVLLALAGCAAQSDVRLGDAAEPPSPVGRWGSGDVAQGPGEPFLEFTDAGEVTGSDGCNWMRGTWTSGPDASISFSPMASTMMACPGVDTWLSTMTTAAIGVDGLQVYGPGGVALGTLPRTG